MSKNKQHISIFFLTVFILIKAVNLHVFTHSESDLDSNDCDLCEYVINSKNTPFVIESPILAEHTIQHNYTAQVFYEYSYQFTQNQIENTLFCRPPPTA